MGRPLWNLGGQIIFGVLTSATTWISGLSSLADELSCEPNVLKFSSGVLLRSLLVDLVLVTGLVDLDLVLCLVLRLLDVDLVLERLEYLSSYLGSSLLPLESSLLLLGVLLLLDGDLL